MSHRLSRYNLGLLSLFCTLFFLIPSYSFSGETYDLRSLKKWVGKNSESEPGAMKLFYDKNFQAALSKVLGDKLYTIYEEGLSNEGRWHEARFETISGKIILAYSSCNVLDCFHDIYIFIDVDNNKLDVLWNGVVSIVDDKVNKINMYFCSDGTKIDMLVHAALPDYAKISSDKRTEILAKDTEELLGVWTGRVTKTYFSKAMLEFNIAIDIFRDSNSSTSVSYIQRIDAILKKGAKLECGETKNFSMETTGEALVGYGMISFIPKSISHPSCTTMNPSTFSYNNDKLKGSICCFGAPVLTKKKR